ncbi:SAM-dependent methyltransferase [Gordonia sihwensis]|uniref:class I SAM-dependent methyltransferase n=1 Tax=Gordonia TaxID=2053 RepID=UPI001C930C69|nr:class I SAM-dependent methyltransferase [Gordonia sihwensis]MBY4569387.1 SAM-dependent methyltransferase [Gordonia sihwensis]WFN92296.1 class I SAM-dependent methyltransferase [Gordonia sihwensis]
MRGAGLAAGRPSGRITRGTTNINRLRRVDRAMAADPRVRAACDVPRPLAVDLGYGGRPDTAVEMAIRLRRVIPDLDLVGLEIDPARIVEPRHGVRFALGGFELAGLRPHLVRAFNVLRQYGEDEVHAAWAQMRSALAPGGLIVEGTCDEIGRRCCWILLDRDGPIELTLAWSPAHTRRPSELAERLPKALIHRNVDGEAIHRLLETADQCWDRAAGREVFGPRDRWRYARDMLRDSGVDVRVPRGRRVDNLLTVPWGVVAPA